MAVPKEAVITDAVKTGWQHMHQETPNELIGVQCHRLNLITVAVILPFEPDVAILDVKQTLIGDRYAMGISPNVVQYLLRPGKRSLCVNHPSMPFRLGQVTGKGNTLGQWP